jgi:hypothetical protein
MVTVPPRLPSCVIGLVRSGVLPSELTARLSGHSETYRMPDVPLELLENVFNAMPVTVMFPARSSKSTLNASE